jgi:RNA polymerase sigma-54 factor
MALTQRLQIRQSQALVMTPQLMQAIKLLQLSNLDLVAYVEAELERNPLLDRGADDEQGPVEAGAAEAPDSPAAEGETWEANSSEPSRSAMEDALDARTDDVFPDAAEPSPQRAAEGPAASTTANTISRRSSRPKPRSPTGCASNWRSRSMSRRGG